MAGLKTVYTKEQRFLWKLQNERNMDVNELKRLSVYIYRMVTSNNIHYSQLSNAGYLHHHNVNVAILAALLGINIEIEVGLIKRMIFGCLVHDIGKLWTIPTILDKPGKLDMVEKGIMDTHTMLGHSVISKFTQDEVICAIVRDHHQYFTSNNNPEIDKNDEKSICAYLCSIADVMDAMLSMRCYKDVLDPQSVINELIKYKVTDEYINMVKNIIFPKEAQKVAKTSN